MSRKLRSIWNAYNISTAVHNYFNPPCCVYCLHVLYILSLFGTFGFWTFWISIIHCVAKNLYQKNVSRNFQGIFVLFCFGTKDFHLALASDLSSESLLSDLYQFLPWYKTNSLMLGYKATNFISTSLQNEIMQLASKNIILRCMFFTVGCSFQWIKERKEFGMKICQK